MREISEYLPETKASGSPDPTRGGAAGVGASVPEHYGNKINPVLVFPRLWTYLPFSREKHRK